MGSDAAGTGSVTRPGGGMRSMPSTGDTRSLERASRPVPPVSAATSPEASASSSHPLYAASWVPSRSRSGATHERLNGLHAADTPACLPSGGYDAGMEEVLRRICRFSWCRLGRNRASFSTTVMKPTGAPRGGREGLNPGRWAHAPGGVGTWALSRVWHRLGPWRGRFCRCVGRHRARCVLTSRRAGGLPSGSGLPGTAPVTMGTVRPTACRRRGLAGFTQTPQSIRKWASAWVSRGGTRFARLAAMRRRRNSADLAGLHAARRHGRAGSRWSRWNRCAASSSISPSSASHCTARTCALASRRACQAEISSGCPW